MRWAQPPTGSKPTALVLQPRAKGLRGRPLCRDSAKVQAGRRGRGGGATGIAVFEGGRRRPGSRCPAARSAPTAARGRESQGCARTCRFPVSGVCSRATAPRDFRHCSACRVEPIAHQGASQAPARSCPAASNQSRPQTPSLLQISLLHIPLLRVPFPASIALLAAIIAGNAVATSACCAEHHRDERRTSSTQEEPYGQSDKREAQRHRGRKTHQSMSSEKTMKSLSLPISPMARR